MATTDCPSSVASPRLLPVAYVNPWGNGLLSVLSGVTPSSVVTHGVEPRNPVLGTPLPLYPLPTTGPMYFPNPPRSAVLSLSAYAKPRRGCTPDFLSGSKWYLEIPFVPGNSRPPTRLRPGTCRGEVAEGFQPVMRLKRSCH